MSGLLIRSGRSFLNQLPASCRPSTIAPTTCVSRLLAHYQFSTSTTNSVDDTPSGRALFKKTPVHPSILRYIQNVGVGKGKRIERKKSRRTSGQFRFMDPNEERKELGRTRRAKTSSTPPIPFPSHSSSPGETTASGKVIQRSPVKLLRTVGTMKQKFPKAFAHLPEVVRMAVRE